nr:hypothetical protein HmN_000054100 [Hymenolepis microstoma]
MTNLARSMESPIPLVVRVRFVSEPTVYKQQPFLKSYMLITTQIKYATSMDSEKVTFLPPLELMNPPSRSSPQNVLVSGTTFELNSRTFAVLSDLVGRGNQFC